MTKIVTSGLTTINKDALTKDEVPDFVQNDQQNNKVYKADNIFNNESDSDSDDGLPPPLP